MDSASNELQLRKRSRSFFTDSISPTTIENLTRYCIQCWKNAGLSPSDWDETTQQVLTELLEHVEPSQWQNLLTAESPQKRELVRTIDRNKKRVQRRKEIAFADTDRADPYMLSRESRGPDFDIERLEREIANLYSERAQKIIRLSLEGEKVLDIAAHLGMTTARVSDEKYKTVLLLREILAAQD